ncbi:MAG: tripartite tricarboxylate transporter substrate binding protein [Pseudomonadota bacterium]
MRDATPAAFAVLLAAVAAPALAAEAWPARPVRVVVPFAPGGTSDIMARVMSQQLSEQLGQAFLVDNRPGASGFIGHGLVAKSAPDGYTIATVDDGFSIIPSVKKEMPYDPVRDFTFITEVMSVPRALVVRPTLKASTVKEFVALAQASQGRMTYASGGSGGINHLSAELFNLSAKVKLIHVPYKGAGAATTGVLTGESDMVIAAAPTVVPQVKAGKLRALGVTTEAGRRFAALPDVPSLADAGVGGMVIHTWFGFLGPAKMPATVVERIQSEAARAIATPFVKERLQGAELTGSTSQAFTAMVRAEMKRWAGVVEAAGVERE